MANAKFLVLLGTASVTTVLIGQAWAGPQVTLTSPPSAPPSGVGTTLADRAGALNRRTLEDQQRASEFEAEVYGKQVKWASKLQSQTEGVLKDTVWCVVNPLACYREGKKPPSYTDLAKLMKEAIDEGLDLGNDLIDLSTRGAENQARRLETERQRRQIDRERKAAENDSPHPPTPPPPPPISLTPNPQKVTAALPENRLTDDELREASDQIYQWCYSEVGGDRCFEDSERFRQFIEQHPSAQVQHDAAIRVPAPPAVGPGSSTGDRLNATLAFVTELNRLDAAMEAIDARSSSLRQDEERCEASCSRNGTSLGQVLGELECLNKCVDVLAEARKPLYQQLDELLRRRSAIKQKIRDLNCDVSGTGRLDCW